MDVLGNGKLIAGNGEIIAGNGELLSIGTCNKYESSLPE